MIFVITNRQVFDGVILEPKDVAVPDMRANLSEVYPSGDRVLTGLLNPSQSDDEADTITFYPKGRESDLFNTLTQQDLDTKWVFFIHGFHQDPQENIDKAKALSKSHKVNVIAFAWPSRPYNEEITEEDVGQTVVTDIFKRTLGASTLVSIGIQAAYKLIKDKWKNYPAAQENAKESGIDLLAAMQLLKDNVPFSFPPVLLVHSLGNFLVKNVVKNNSLPLVFSHIVYHQADVNSEAHEWILNTSNNLAENGKLYVTINIHDFVLSASMLQKKARRFQFTERLGHTAHNFTVSSIKYIDFSYGQYVNVEHEFFKLAKSDTNESVYHLLNRLFNGQDDELPVNIKQTSSGFIKMPTEVSLFQLEKIIDPVDDIELSEDDEPDFISPLNRFKDPLERDDDEEDEGD